MYILGNWKKKIDNEKLAGSTGVCVWGGGGGANNHVVESHSDGYPQPLTLNSVYTLTSSSAVSLKAQFPPGTLT